VLLVGCREEKIKRAMRQQKHASAASETASDRSTELKPEALTFPLAAAPERGILKKVSSQGSITGVKPSRLSRPLLATNGPSGDSTPTNEVVENGQRSPTAAAAVTDVANSNGFEFIDGVDEDDGSCSCSCDEDDMNVAVVDDSAAVDPKTPENLDCAGAGGCSVETQTDPESMTSSMTSLFDPGEKMTRLCNINELLRQIDEQFNSVLRATSLTLQDVPADLSPTNSDDVRGSETEADRACPKFFPHHGTNADDAVDSQFHASSSDTKLAEATAPDCVIDVAMRPVIRPVPLVPHRPNPSPVVSDTTESGGGPQSITAPILIPHRGATVGPVSAVSADHLPSCTVPPGTSSSPATVTSEGYHSDRMLQLEPDLPVIIREIPKSSTMPAHCVSDVNMRPQSKQLNSPDDVDV